MQIVAIGQWNFLGSNVVGELSTQTFDHPTTTLPKPIKQWNASDWSEYYRDPQKFAQVFHDYRNLTEEAKRHTLSSSQIAQLHVARNLIDGKMSD